MTKLSVNINKIATVRNARGSNLPDVVKAAINCEKFGAQGITVHPDLTKDISDTAMCVSSNRYLLPNSTLKATLSPLSLTLVMEIRPAQVTLVPDAEDVLHQMQDGYKT